jgi:hypothetical protein
MARKHPAAVALGSLGGKKRSEAKARAARDNGAKGGRPGGYIVVRRIPKRTTEYSDTVAAARLSRAEAERVSAELNQRDAQTSTTYYVDKLTK